MKASRGVLYLCIGVGVSAVIASVVGSVWTGTGAAIEVTTFRGDAAELYGRGLYENDTLFAAANNRSSDLATLFIALPLLVLTLRGYLRGSPRARFLLLGVLGYFVYIGSSYALGAVAFNELFLVYVVLFSTSLFAFVTVFTSLDASSLKAAGCEDMPRRGPGLFLVASGVVTLAIWVQDPVAALLTGEPPKRLDTYSTLFTHAFDIGVIVPAAFLAGIWILRGRTFGYAIAFSLLVLEAMLLPLIAVATFLQVRMGIDFPPAEIVGPIAGFGIFAAGSVWVLATLLRAVPNEVGSIPHVRRQVLPTMGGGA